MSLIRIGVLSDTHLTTVSREFQEQVERCFPGVDMILHAGDLTSLAVLDVFAGIKVFAVHGNMCDYSAYGNLPAKRVITVGRFRIGLCHGAGIPGDIETGLLGEFDQVDCIVYGHTHRPVCHRQGGVLLVNPGTFRATGRYGSPGTYAIIEAGSSLAAQICQVGG